jgi:hypothetical protein
VHAVSIRLIGAWLLLGFPALGQPVVPPGNLPKEGDAFVLGVDRSPVNIHPLAPDGGRRWDFTSLQAPFARRFTWEITSSAQQFIGPGPNFSAAVYMKTANELRLQQMVGQDPFGLSLHSRVVYSPAMPVRKLPQRMNSTFQYNGLATATAAIDDIPKELSQKLPFRPDSVRLKVNVRLLSTIDDWGKALIPGGIFEVLREKHTYTYEFQVEVKLGQRRWQNITSSSQVKGLFPKTTAVSYNFWSDDALEPIVVLIMDRSGNNTERAEFKIMDLDETPILKHPVPDFFVYPNPAISDVRIEFFMLPPGEYEIIFKDMIGKVRIQKKIFITGNRIEKLDISDLDKGPYYYQVRDERGVLVGNTKRLIVIRP